MTQRFKGTAFAIGFLVYLIILYADSFKLSAGSRAFPLAIIGVALIAVGLKLLTLYFPRLRFLDPSGNIAKDVLHLDDSCSDDVNADAAVSKDEKWNSPSVKIFLFMLWLITFGVGVYLIGFLPTMAVWLFIFLAGISRIKVWRALLLSVGTFGILYVVFVTILSTHFPRGILF